MSVLRQVPAPTRGLVFAVVALALALAATASGIDTSDGLVHGCYYIVDTPQYRAGTLRIVDPGTSCPAGQQAPISWRIAGGVGLQGATGPKGADGLVGPRGPEGKPGPPGFRGRGGRSASSLPISPGVIGDVHVRALTFRSPAFSYDPNSWKPAFFEAPCGPGEEPVAAGATVQADTFLAAYILSSYPDPARHAWEVEVVVPPGASAERGKPWSVGVTVTCWPGYPSRPPIAHHFITGEKVIPLP